MSLSLSEERHASLSGCFHLSIVVKAAVAVVVLYLRAFPGCVVSLSLWLEGATLSLLFLATVYQFSSEVSCAHVTLYAWQSYPDYCLLKANRLPAIVIILFRI